MTIDKAFEQLKLAALDVKSLLLDIDENIRPSVKEIEELQAKVNVLVEQMAVYKYVETEKEIAPNLNLHMKVMEKVAQKEDVVFASKEVEMAEKISHAETTIEAVRVEMPPSVKKMEFSLNDKFRIINELFKQSSTEFNLAIEQLNTFANAENSRVYLDELKRLYGWKDDHEMVVKMYQLNQKRFQ